MDPTRLVNGEAEPFEAELLRAGECDAMPQQSRNAIFGALGLTGGAIVDLPFQSDVGTATTSAMNGGSSVGANLSGATTAAAGPGTLSATKAALSLLGAGIVGGVSIWGAVQLAQPADAPTAVNAGSANVVAPPAVIEAIEVDDAAEVSATDGAERATSVEALPQVEEPVEAKQERAVKPRKAIVNSEGALTQELSVVDGARSALQQNQPSLALRRLNDYDRRFPKGKLRSEATMLRIEALVAKGDQASAARIGKAVLKASPKGPYSRRIRSLIGQGKDSDALP